MKTENKITQWGKYDFLNRLGASEFTIFFFSSLINTAKPSTFLPANSANLTDEFRKATTTSIMPPLLWCPLVLLLYVAFPLRFIPHLKKENNLQALFFICVTWVVSLFASIFCLIYIFSQYLIASILNQIIPFLSHN